MKPGDKILKKRVDKGICEGIVIDAWSTWIRVKWNNGPHVNCFADSVVLDTPENRAVLEEKWNKRQAKLMEVK